MPTPPPDGRPAPRARGWWRALPFAALAVGACDPRAAPAPAAVAGPPAPRLTNGPPQAGTRAVVDFAWRTSDARAWLHIGEGRAAGAADVEGQLQLEVHSRDEAGRTPIRARLLELSVRRWEVLGAAVPIEASSRLDDVGMVLDTDAAGAVLAVRTAGPGDASSLLLLRNVVSLLLHRAPPGEPSTWRSVDPTPFGQAEVEYARGPAGSLGRSLLGYRTVEGPVASAYAWSAEGHRAASFAEDGLPQSVEDAQRLTATAHDGHVVAEAELSFRARRAGTEREAPRALSPVGWADASLDLRGLADSPAARRAALERRVGGLGFQRVLDRVTIVAAGGGAEQDGQFLFQATGLLLLDPSLAPRLAARLGDALASAGSDQLVADLLAFSGSPEAQRALLAALRVPGAERALHFPLLVQRLGFVAEPVPEVDELVRALLRESPVGSDLAIAAQYAVGAVAGKLARTGEITRAAALVEELERWFDAAASALEVRHGAVALANTRLVSVMPRLVLASAHADPEVRRALAESLAVMPGPVARRVLLGLALAPEADVAAAALHSLRDHSLAVAELAGLAGAAADGRVAEGADAELLALLDEQPPEPAALARALRVLADRSGDRPAVHALLERTRRHLAPSAAPPPPGDPSRP